MQQHATTFPIKTMCRVLDASRSGYYDWLRRQQHPGERQHHRQQPDRRVAAAFGC
jgi:hypothetical protein